MTTKPFFEHLDAHGLEGEKIAPFFETQELKKGTYFIQENRVCRKAAFLEQGLMLYSKTEDSGQEIICDFAKEGDWVTQYESFIQAKTSPLSIKALEDCRLQVIKREQLLELYQVIPNFELYTRSVLERFFVASLARNLAFQTLKAEERYLKFRSDSPELVQRLPQYYLASYLGIAPQSLSRIRKNFTR